MIKPLHIQIALAALGMSRADLGKAIGVTGQTVNRFILNGRGVNVGTVADMEKYFRERGIIFLDEGDLPGKGIGIWIKHQSEAPGAQKDASAKIDLS